jgi:hypothetical protein
MGGTFALLGGFVGLVGVSTMIARWSTWGADPIGLILFSVLLANGLFAVYRRLIGAEEQTKKKGPFSKRSSKR